ncbi:hypothetical protein BJ742DRAFT_857589 [Cladochytrium replicatum]|nr:hypothetical protein BJ742DRAFT_857589 [Cladochytrium replicatum]
MGILGAIISRAFRAKSSPNRAGPTTQEPATNENTNAGGDRSSHNAEKAEGPFGILPGEKSSGNESAREEPAGDRGASATNLLSPTWQSRRGSHDDLGKTGSEDDKSSKVDVVGPLDGFTHHKRESHHGKHRGRRSMEGFSSSGSEDLESGADSRTEGEFHQPHSSSYVSSFFEFLYAARSPSPTLSRPRKMRSASGLTGLWGLDLGLDLGLDSMNLSETEEEALRHRAKSHGLFAEYSVDDIRMYMGKVGVLEQLEKLGYKDLEIVLDTTDPFVHRMTVTDYSLLSPEKAEKLRHAIAHPQHGRPIHNIVHLSESMFLIDMFVRRRDQMEHHEIKGYQDLVRWAAEPTPTELDRRARSISPGPLLWSHPQPDEEQLSPGQLALHDRRISSTETKPEQLRSETKRKFRLTSEDAHLVLDYLDRTTTGLGSPGGKLGKTGIAVDVPLPKRLTVTCVEWLCMQNPKARFERPAAPGQKFPGLGVANKFITGLVLLAKKKARDGLLNTPENFHNALLNSSKGWKFINPAFQGYVEALVDNLHEDIKKHGVPAVSFAFLFGLVKDQFGVTEVWTTQDQLLPTSKTAQTYFDSRAYKQLVKLFFQKFRWADEVRPEDSKRGRSSTDDGRETGTESASESEAKLGVPRVTIDWDGAPELLSRSIANFVPKDTGAQKE